MPDFQEKEKENERAPDLKLNRESNSKPAPIDTGDSAVTPVTDEEQ
ncbi:MAG: hypothetical protein R3D26_17120 [Cyanobacteriota/Melainabacteria group bacterium]